MGKKKQFQVNDKRQYYREEYLKSDHWKNLREEKLKQFSVCEVCGAKKSLDVHHKRYKNLYDVLLIDLQVLCRKHHKQIHEKLKKPKKEPRKKKIQRKIIKRWAKDLNLDRNYIRQIIKTHIPQ